MNGTSVIGEGIEMRASRRLLLEQQRRQRGGGRLRLRAGDGDVGEAVGALALLHEVHEALLGGSKRSISQAAQGKAPICRQRRDRLVRIDHEKPAVIDQGVTGLGLRDPGIEVDVGDLGAALCSTRGVSCGSGENAP